MFFVLLGMALGMSSSALANELEVIPLNSISEKVLKNSPLSSYVVSPHRFLNKSMAIGIIL